MEVDNNNKTKDKINMKPGGKFEFPLLMHKINVLPIKLSCFISLNSIFMFIYFVFVYVVNKVEWLTCNSLAAERIEQYSFVIFVSISLTVIL